MGHFHGFVGSWIVSKSGATLPITRTFSCTDAPSPVGTHSTPSAVVSTSMARMM